MKRIAILLTIMIVMTLTGCASGDTLHLSVDNRGKPTIGIAWNNVRSYSFESTVAAANELDANIVELPMAHSYDLSYDAEDKLTDSADPVGYLSADAAKLVKRNTWQNSDVEDVLKDVDAVIFPGGSDISPTLYYEEQPWHGIEAERDYCAERDVSDYMLMSYCLEHDIPTLGICRGMQMLSVVSGATVVQDVETWFAEQGIEYHDMHRDPEKKDLVPHDVEIVAKDSLLFSIFGQTQLTGCPSWHHQIVGDVSGTRLTVTAQTMTDGLPVIEAVERRDKTFCMGVQFHPEVAVRKHLDHAENEADFMDYDTAMKCFRALEDAAISDTAAAAA